MIQTSGWSMDSPLGCTMPGRCLLGWNILRPGKHTIHSSAKNFKEPNRLAAISSIHIFVCVCVAKPCCIQTICHPKASWMRKVFLRTPRDTLWLFWLHQFALYWNFKIQNTPFANDCPMGSPTRLDDLRVLISPFPLRFLSQQLSTAPLTFLYFFSLKPLHFRGLFLKVW